MTIKGIIFDLDGTLLYTLEDLKNSVNYALKSCNLKEITLEQTRNFVGNGIGKLIERAIENNQKKYLECLEIFKQHYKENSNITTKPYPMVIENLKRLKEKNIKLAILSNKIDSEVKKLSKLYFDNIFDISQGETAKFDKKPDPKSSEFIIKQFNLKKEEVIFVGDSEVDIQTAKNASIECLSVTWGYKDKDFLIKNGAVHIYENFKDLTDYIIENS